MVWSDAICTSTQWTSFANFCINAENTWFYLHRTDRVLWSLVWPHSLWHLPVLGCCRVRNWRCPRRTSVNTGTGSGFGSDCPLWSKCCCMPATVTFMQENSSTGSSIHKHRCQQHKTKYRRRDRWINILARSSDGTMEAIRQLIIKMCVEYWLQMVKLWILALMQYTKHNPKINGKDPGYLSSFQHKA
jgi:hypothetical protein